jgi:hypothetical protein
VEDSLLYILPQASADALLPLAFSPPPRALRRVFVVRVDVSALNRVDVRARRVTVTGAISEQVVRRLVRRHIRQLGFCLRSNDDATEVTLDWRVLTTGAVPEATADGEHVSEEERGCLVRAARRMTFPSAETVTTVSQELVIRR